MFRVLASVWCSFLDRTWSTRCAGDSSSGGSTSSNSGGRTSVRGWYKSASSTNNCRSAYSWPTRCARAGAGFSWAARTSTSSVTGSSCRSRRCGAGSSYGSRCTHHYGRGASSRPTSTHRSTDSWSYRTSEGTKTGYGGSTTPPGGGVDS